MIVDIKLLKKLREETKISIADCRTALEETGNDYKKAKEWLKKKGIEKADKKKDREVKIGIIESYVHQDKRTASMVSLLCETDFVAKTDDFKNLAHEIAMQITAMNPKDVASLLKQEYIRDNSVTIEQLIKTTIAKLGENIVINKFIRFEI
jgi:elongation factor Ts